MKKYIILCMLSLLLLGCQNKNIIPTSPDTSFEKDDSDMFTDRDYDDSYDINNSILIELNGDSVSCDSNKVKINGSVITITSNDVFVISGSLNNGYIIVDADNIKPQIVLNGVNINSDSFAGIYVKKADKVFITLADNTDNYISSNDFVLIDENNVDAAIFSKSDLTVNGNGSLNITSNNHGIVSKDDLVLSGGKYLVNSNGHGLSGNDSIRISQANINIESQKDGIHAENTDDTSLGYIYLSSGNINIKSADDGISSSSNIQIEAGNYDIYTGSGYTTLNTSLKAIKATSSILINGGVFKIDAYDDAVHSNSSVVINNGEFEITTNDDGIHADEILEINGGVINIIKSYEGLEALNVTINNGNINVVSKDDGINAAGGNDNSGFTPGMGGRPGRPGDNFGGSSGNGKIIITGGNINIEASGDGIDANGNLEISGGVVYVCGPTTGDTAVLDYDGTGIISGGEFYGTGSRMMAQTLTSDTQGVISVNVGSVNAGVNVVITDSSGNVVASITPNLSYQIVIVSNNKIIKGDTYTITIGSNNGNVIAK